LIFYHFREKRKEEKDLCRYIDTLLLPSPRLIITLNDWRYMVAIEKKLDAIRELLPS
jgi:hypothetical protein